MSELVIFSSLNRHQRSSILLSWKRKFVLTHFSSWIVALYCWQLFAGTINLVTDKEHFNYNLVSTKLAWQDCISIIVNCFDGHVVKYVMELGSFFCKRGLCYWSGRLLWRNRIEFCLEFCPMIILSLVLLMVYKRHTCTL